MRVAVAALIENETGSILLTKRRDFDVWCLPGGIVDGVMWPEHVSNLVHGADITLKKRGMMEKEGPKDAVLREVYEETGLRVHVHEAVGMSWKPNWMDGTLLIIFKCTVINGRLNKVTEETTDAAWFSPGSLPVDIAGEHKIYINIYNFSHQCFYKTFTLPRWNGERKDLYSLRDSSGLTPQEFFRKFFEGQWENVREEFGPVLK